MSISQLLIICPLIFLAGLVDSISGGGGLISMPAYMFAGLPVHSAIATNKLSATMGTSVATIKYIQNKFVPWKFVPTCVIGAFAGSFLGANIALLVTDYYFKIILLFILPLIAFYVLKTKKIAESGTLEASTKTNAIATAISFTLGIYDGFYGPGTGTFLILLLSFFTHMKLQNANGLTKAINLSTDISALAVFLMHGKVLVPIGITAGFFNIAGNYIGATLFSKKSGKYTRPFLLFILALFYAKLIYELFIVK